MDAVPNSSELISPRPWRTPGNPLRLARFADSSDHLHPNDAGYQAMANAVDLNLLRAAIQ